MSETLGMSSIALPPEELSSAKKDRSFELAALLSPAIPTEVFESYWKFAHERQSVFFRRQGGMEEPWTDDPIISTYRFTNAYRVADRVSQYLLKHVQYNRSWSSRDTFFRTILFKIFNRIDTWESLEEEVGEICLKNFDTEHYGNVLDRLMEQGRRIYSAAYIMPSGGPKSSFRRKHNMHLDLLQRMISDGVVERIEKCKSMEESFNLLRKYPTIGDFLAYQYAVDLNYSELTDFCESEFVKAGPGAKEGIGKCFSSLGGKSLEWVIRKSTEVQEEAFRLLGLNFCCLSGRRLQLIDCQNLYCEVAKYARVKHPEYSASTGRTRIKQRFSPVGRIGELFLPPKWRRR